MSDFSFSEVVFKENYKDQLIKSSFIPERMVMGMSPITPGEVTRSKFEIIESEIGQKCLPSKLGLL